MFQRNGNWNVSLTVLVDTSVGEFETKARERGRAKGVYEGSGSGGGRGGEGDSGDMTVIIEGGMGYF